MSQRRAFTSSWALKVLFAPLEKNWRAAETGMWLKSGWNCSPVHWDCVYHPPLQQVEHSHKLQTSKQTLFPLFLLFLPFFLPFPPFVPPSSLPFFLPFRPAVFLLFSHFPLFSSFSLLTALFPFPFPLLFPPFPPRNLLILITWASSSCCVPGSRARAVWVLCTRAALQEGVAGESHRDVTLTLWDCAAKANVYCSAAPFIGGSGFMFTYLCLPNLV